jgi:Tfp pilus assembly protein PilN
MEKMDLDGLQLTYKEAVDRWVAAIRAEEALANADHSETAMENWDRADFAVQDAQNQARDAREQYKDGLRQLHYGM